MKKYTQDEQIQHCDEWKVALTSGKYKQIRRLIRNGENGRCVIGVGLEIMGEDVVSTETLRDMVAYYGLSGAVIGDLVRDNDNGALFSSLAQTINSINLKKKVVESMKHIGREG